MEESDPLIGRVLHGTIRIRKRIGSGGMGHVYEGYQEHLDRIVAVKVLTPEHARNPIAAEYFLREARSASGLRHPNIIQIIDYGTEEDGTLFLAMEYVPGLPLGRIIRKEFPLSTERIVSILDQTLAGLGEAHRKQIVHRDLKPDNLMVETLEGRDFVKVLDFGIAQSRAPERKVGPLTRQGAVVGTPQYMSPEQAMGEAVDARSDLFAVGSILYELLTQKCPFKGKSLPEILIAVIKHHPQPPSSLRPELGIDPRLEAVCLRAMKKEPDLRYQDAEAFRTALRAVLASEPAPAPAASPAQFFFRGRKKRESETTPVPAVEADGAAPTTGNTTIDTPVPPARDEDASSPRTQRQIAPAQERKGLGVDLGKLREDLLGERAWTTALVSHQSSRARIEAEELITLRRHLDAVHQAVAHRWGGVVHGRQGGFVTLLFGFPRPSPDDAKRATQAALELRRDLGRVAPESTSFGFAVAHGEVFCPDGQLASVAGAPIDDASEAARAAGPGEVRVCGELRDSLNVSFRLCETDVPDSWIVDGQREAAELVDAHEDRPDELVGRDDEVAAILGWLARSSDARGGVLAMLGEPGVGKTALVQEVIRLVEFRGFRVARARAQWDGPELVRWIRVRWIIDLLRQHGRSLRDAEMALMEMGAPAAHARLLAAYVHDRLDDALEYRENRRGLDAATNADESVRVALRALVRHLATDRPLLLVVDDLLGYSGSIAREVAAWAELTDDLPVFLAFASRIEPGGTVEEPPRHATVLRVAPLEEDAARALLRVRLGPAASHAFIQRLARVGAGLPLHLEHLARHARRAGEVDDDTAAGWLASSRDIGELLRARLLSFTRPVQNVLALLSVLGDGTPGDVLVDLASDEWEPEAAIQQLYEEGLVELEQTGENPRLFFRPPAMARVVYEQLSRKMRRRIHARAARYYGERARADSGSAAHEDLIALVRHLERSGEEESALHALDLVIDRAWRRFEFDIVDRYILRALRILRAGDYGASRVASYELRRVRAAVAMGRRGQALDICRALERDDSLDARTMAEVKVQLAELWLENEDPDLVERYAHNVIGTVKDLHRRQPDDRETLCLLVRSLQLMASTHERAGRHAIAAQFALEAAELIDDHAIDPADNPYGPSLVWKTLNQLGRLRMHNGEANGARALFEAALRVATQAEDPRGEVAVRANIASLASSDGQLEAAHQSLGAALRIAQRINDPRAIARLEYNRGQLHLRQRETDAAREAFAASLKLSDELDWREGIAMCSERLRALDAADERMRADTMRITKR